MTGDAGSIRYSLREPFDRAVDAVRRSLVTGGLRVAGQVDISKHVERALGIVLPRCSIVFVLPNPSTLSLPLHIVISGDGSQTEIQVQNRFHTGPEANGLKVSGPVAETQAQVCDAMDEIAMRASMAV